MDNSASKSSSRAPDLYEKTPVDNVSRLDCKVTEIQFKGLEQTNPEIIHRELEPVFKANNLEEIYEELQKLIHRLNKLDIFQSMDVHITETKKDEENACRLECEFVEKRGWHAMAKTFVQGTEAGIEGRLGLRNVRGRADKVTLFFDYGSHKSIQSAIQYIQPNFMGTEAEFATKLFNSSKSNRHYSAYDESLKGINFSLFSSDMRHKVSYDLGWQQLTDHQLLASIPVQQQLGNRIRSSMSYQFLYDERQLRHLSSGFACRCNSELNGLFPHESVLKTLKNKLDLQLSWKFLPFASLAIGSTAGLLFPLTRDYAKVTTSLSERFYLGGVDSFKGFHLNGIGPHAFCRPTASDHKKDYLGGEVLCAAYASLNLFAANPTKQSIGVHAHLFGNIGNVSPLSSFVNGHGALRDNLERFGKAYRASVGVGIVLPTPLGNFEVNYAIPIRFSENDSIRSGLQMSFGTDPFTV